MKTRIISMRVFNFCGHFQTRSKYSSLSLGYSVFNVKVNHGSSY